MANIKSAEKRIKTNERNRVKNRFYKSSIRTFMKRFLQNLEVYQISQTSEDKEKAQKLLSLIYSVIDKGAGKKIFPKKTAARKKAKLAAYFKAASF